MMFFKTALVLITLASALPYNWATVLQARAPAQVVTSCTVPNTAALTFVCYFFNALALSNMLKSRTMVLGFTCKLPQPF